MAHPHVLEAAVIAVPHEKWSERPLALVVPKTGVQPNVQDLLDLIESQFAKFWIPDEIRFVAEIPKTSVGKFDKKVLRQRYADGAL
jgi:fatty-acyl-CoA synthase